MERSTLALQKVARGRLGTASAPPLDTVEATGASAGAKDPPSKKSRVAEPSFVPCAELDEDPVDASEAASDESERLPTVRCSEDQLWAEIATVRASPEFEHAAYHRVVESEVENLYKSYLKPRGGVNIQIARAFSALCGDANSA